MATIIDRREIYKDRSSGSRKRFIERHKEAIRESIEKSVRDSKGFTDILDGDKNKRKEIRIRKKGIDEPNFVHGEGGEIERILPGNDQYNAGDDIFKPDEGGGRGRGAGRDGEGEDDFVFHLNRNEFMDLLFEGLELPDLVKKNLIQAEVRELVHDGFTPFGSPGQMDVIRSYRNSLGRRIGLGRKGIKEELEELEAELAVLNAVPLDGATLYGRMAVEDAVVQKVFLEERIERLKGKLRAIPYFDTIDMRYRHRDWETKPTTSAVMFCLMDVSGSMTDRHKTIAKYFFLLLHLFLKRQYQNVHLVFIRHTSDAKEVDEREFFHGQETGGTIVMSALELCHKIIRERYDTNTWNIYIAQASDGDSFNDDADACHKFLNTMLLPISQYMVYVQIDHDRSQLSNNFGMKSEDPSNELWQSYTKVRAESKNFDMGWIGDEKKIYPVFRRLFEKKP